MSSSRLVRGAKTRMFAVVCLISVLGAVMFVFHGTQSKLAEVQKLVNSCNQQQESLSAQLQVIFEYKGRLEKSLTKEKEDHKQTKDTLEAKLKEEKSLREKDVQEAKNKFEALLQQNKFLQNQLDDSKENEKKTISKLKDENKQLLKDLEDLKQKHNKLAEQKMNEVEDLKTSFLEHKKEIKTLKEENEHLKLRAAPEADQKNHLEKENLQLKDELEKQKQELDECKDAKVKPNKPEIQPDTNVGEMPPGGLHIGQKSTNGSTTPGLNPEAVNNFEISSQKPSSDAEGSIAKKIDEQVAQPSNKKPTQESVGAAVPIALPQQQIPGPNGLDRNPFGNTLHKPNTGGAGQAEEAVHLQIRPDFMGPAGQGGEPDVGQQFYVQAPPDNRAAEEENFQKQAEIPRLRSGDNYPHGGDYEHEREQPDDEEDDEGEQPDYDERARKEQKNPVVQQQPLKIPVQNHEGGGVMVNPK